MWKILSISLKLNFIPNILGLLWVLKNAICAFLCRLQGYLCWFRNYFVSFFGGKANFCQPIVLKLKIMSPTRSSEFVLQFAIEISICAVLQTTFYKVH